MDADRRSDAARRLALAEQAERAEATQAQVLIDEFIQEALRRGMAPKPLMATTFDGQVVKTDREGWYLNRSRNVAIASDGAYVRLVVPAQRFARWRRVTLEPQLPPLEVGRGGRDGEGGPLRDFLAWVLEGRTPQ